MEELKKIPKLAIIIPCFNEEEVLPTTIEKLFSILNFLIEKKEISQDSFLFFVDDGSLDKTWKILNQAHTLSPDKVKCIKFTKNFGNQSAIIAGLKEVYLKTDADCTITIDADLQQDETKILDFIQKMQEGFDIVAGVKIQRGQEVLWKKITAKLFYKTMKLLGVDLVENHSEFRLLTRNALSKLMKYHENGMFLRGILNEMGLKTTTVDFCVKPREGGISKFSFISLLKLGFSGLVSHTTKPLSIIFALGLSTTLCCFLVLTVAVILEFTTPNGLTNVHFFEVWNTFLSGIQILCLGIMGQYIGQILKETKHRPNYLIEEEKL